MTFVEFVGFLISMFALIFIFLRRSNAERYRQEHPEEAKEVELEQQKMLQELFKTLEIDTGPLGIEPPKKKESFKKPVPPPTLPRELPKRTSRRVKHDYEFESRLDEYEKHSVIEDHHLQPKITDETIDVYDEDIVSQDMQFSEKMERVYSAERKVRRSRAQLFVGGIEDKRALFLSYEIFHKPRGLLPIESFEYYKS